jgi:hypothetical protein
MKVLKAKIKKTSIHYKKGVNQKGKSIWLSITGFNPKGEHNYKIKAVKGIKNGFAEYVEIWVSPEDITIKQHEDGQLTLDIFSPQEMEENKQNPRYYNQRRFEVITKNEKQYFQVPDFEAAQRVAKQYGLTDFTIKQVKRLSKRELED